MPMSSPHMTRILGWAGLFGLSDLFGVLCIVFLSYLQLEAPMDVRIPARLWPGARNDHRFSHRALFEWSDLKHHAHDRGDPDQEKNERGNQSERQWKDGLAVDEPFLPHRLSQVAQPQHELHVVDDADNEHDDTQPD